MQDLGYLNESQITSIIDNLRTKFSHPDFPLIRGPINKSNNYALDSFLDLLRKQLRSNKIKKSISLDTIEAALLEKMIDLNVKPGAYVGYTATEAICQPVTQMTLKSFHNAGSSKSMGKIAERINEILSATKNRKNNTTYVFFHKIDGKFLDFDQVYKKIKDFVGIDFRSIFKSYSIEKNSNEWWYSEAVRSKRFRLRFVLNKDTMYLHELSPQFITDILNKKTIDNLYVFSPMSIGLLDIFLKSESDSESEILDRFLEKRSFLERCHLRGIPGIISMAPQTKLIIPACTMGKIEMADKEIILLNHRAMHKFGLSNTDMLNLLSNNGKVSASFTESYTGTPDIIIQGKVDLKDDYYKNLNIVIAELEGTNLDYILCMDGIDTSMTYTNNFSENVSILGIEATRYLLIREFQELIDATGGDINGKNLILLGDIMSNLGELIGNNYNGIVKQQNSILGKSTNERGYKLIMDAAGFGYHDTLVEKFEGRDLPVNMSVSVGIITGKLGILCPQRNEQENNYIKNIISKLSGNTINASKLINALQPNLEISRDNQRLMSDSKIIERQQLLESDKTYTENDNIVNELLNSNKLFVVESPKVIMNDLIKNKERELVKTSNKFEEISLESF